MSGFLSFLSLFGFSIMFGYGFSLGWHGYLFFRAYRRKHKSLLRK